MKCAVLSSISLGRCFLLHDCSGLLVLFNIEIEGGWKEVSFCWKCDALFWCITKLVLSCDLLVSVTNKWPINLQLASPCLLPVPQRGQGASVFFFFSANEAEEGKFCFCLSVWIPFIALSGSSSNCCRFLCIEMRGELVETGRQHVTCMCLAQAVLFFLSLDIMLCSRQMCAT